MHLESILCEFGQIRATGNAPMRINHWQKLSLSWHMPASHFNRWGSHHNILSIATQNVIIPRQILVLWWRYPTLLIQNSKRSWSHFDQKWIKKKFQACVWFPLSKGVLYGLKEANLYIGPFSFSTFRRAKMGVFQTKHVIVWALPHDQPQPTASRLLLVTDQN